MKHTPPEERHVALELFADEPIQTHQPDVAMRPAVTQSLTERDICHWCRFEGKDAALCERLKTDNGCNVVFFGVRWNKLDYEKSTKAEKMRLDKKWESATVQTK